MPGSEWVTAMGNTRIRLELWRTSTAKYSYFFKCPMRNISFICTVVGNGGEHVEYAQVVEDVSTQLPVHVCTHHLKQCRCDALYTLLTTLSLLSKHLFPLFNIMRESACPGHG